MPTHVAYNTRQINKSDRAMMWLYTSSKPHINAILKKNRRFKAFEIVKSILKNDLAEFTSR